MKNQYELSIVIPVFNEAESLEPLFEKISAAISKTWRSELIFINDGSTDRSWELIQKLINTPLAEVAVSGINLRRNFGKAAALNIGFQRALGERVVTIDADLQDDPAEIPNLIAKLDEGYDLVSGWKKDRQDPLEKKLPSRVFNKLTRLMTGLNIHDMNCGFKIYESVVVKEISIYGELHRFIPALAHANGFRVTEIPVKHHAREFGQSKYGFKRYLSGFFDLITVFATTKFLQKPLHLFGIPSLFIGGTGAAVLAYLSISKVFFGHDIESRPLFFLGILCVLFSSQLISIGLLGEMFNRQLSRNDTRRFIRTTLSSKD